MDILCKPCWEEPDTHHETCYYHLGRYRRLLDNYIKCQLEQCYVRPCTLWECTLIFKIMITSWMSSTVQEDQGSLLQQCRAGDQPTWSKLHHMLQRHSGNHRKIHVKWTQMEGSGSSASLVGQVEHHHRHSRLYCAGIRGQGVLLLIKSI